MDFKQISKEIQQGKFSPMYLLYGDEPYYIDSLTKLIATKALEEHERDFNQTVLYGKDCDLLSLISELKSYPMMAEKRVVILKEAQDFKPIDELESFFESPLESTVFVVCYKYKSFDARKKLLKLAAKNGLVFKSDKVREYQLAEWIQAYVKSIGYGITSKAGMLLAEFLGNDLGRIVKEIEKLSILIEAGTTINEVHIEENIGISKDFNIFELTNAIAKKDSVKAFQIVQYFEYNPKAGELVVIIPNLFKLFTQLMKIHFLPNKSREAVAQALGVVPFVAGELSAQKNNYDPKKLAQNIATLHEYDLKAKGVGNATTPSGELLREMTYKLLY
jgi:DNA polymerase-3 subunit delta